MTDGIGYFDVNNIWGRGGLLLGGNAERANTVKYLLGRWNHDDGALVVLDADGSLYEQYGGRGLLVDLASANSAVPDVYSSVVNHRKYGRTPALSAKLIADAVIREKQDRTSNDAFWSQGAGRLSRSTLHTVFCCRTYTSGTI